MDKRDPGPTWLEHRAIEARIERAEVYSTLAFVTSATLLACFVIGMVVVL